jgi:hypothetical protein
MNTIKIPVKVTTVEETFVEVELPCYTKVGHKYYFVENENKGVDIYLPPHGTIIISNTFSADKAFDAGYELIAQQEFGRVFEKAINTLALDVK